MELFTKKQISRELRVSLRTVDRLLKSGDLKYLKIGRLVRITEGQLNQFLQTCETANFPAVKNSNI